MNLFCPRTFSTDWEIMVIDGLQRCQNSGKLEAFAGLLRSELDLPIQVDWNSLEFALGINTGFDQFLERIKSATDRATQVLREFGLELFPAGSHPIEPMYNSSHIHVGTLHDEIRGMHLESMLLRYVPVFGAIGANSPFAHGYAAEFKSYRILDNAYNCTCPPSIRDPRLAQWSWGTDAGPKVYSAPTLEVRITDCASSRRMLAELAVFTAAFVHTLGEDVTEYKVSEAEYKEYLTNRWMAAKYGLQASFIWDGKAIPVVEIMDEMLDRARPGLKALDADRRDLTVLSAMLQKRTCQADFVLELATRYPDPYCLASVHSKLVRDWEAFEDYISSAPPLDPVAVPTEDEIRRAHLAFVGEGTHFYNLRDVMQYPAPLVDEMMEDFVKRGLVQVDLTSRGALLSRYAQPCVSV